MNRECESQVTTSVRPVEFLRNKRSLASTEQKVRMNVRRESTRSSMASSMDFEFLASHILYSALDQRFAGVPHKFSSDGFSRRFQGEQVTYSVSMASVTGPEVKQKEADRRTVGELAEGRLGDGYTSCSESPEQ